MINVYTEVVMIAWLYLLHDFLFDPFVNVKYFIPKDFVLVCFFSTSQKDDVSSLRLKNINKHKKMNSI